MSDPSNMSKEKYSKIHLSIPHSLLTKLDEVKQYPFWKNNRSAVITAALEEFLKNNQEADTDEQGQEPKTEK